jgi:hypothetical protein
VNATARPLAKLPDAWLAAYKQYFGENGWEDGTWIRRDSRESAFVPKASQTASSSSSAAAAAGPGVGGRKAGPFGPELRPGTAPELQRPPHWYSARPPTSL